MAIDRRYALLVFDWDGTLIDSAAAIAECIQLAARDMMLAVPDLARASHVIGLGLEDALRFAVPDLPRTRYPEFVASYRQHFLAREDSMTLFPGVGELLGRLDERGHLLAVATGKSRRGLDRALGASGLGRLFVATRCGDESRPKPDPAMLLELLELLAVPAERALMIGDTSHDLDMARNAGVDAVAVAYGAHSDEDLRARRPLACVTSVEELSQWLDGNA